MTETSLAPVFSIKDDRFSVENIEHYELLMEQSNSFFRLAVLDTINQVYIWLEDYETENWDDLSEIIKQHPFIAAQYWNKVSLSVNATAKCILPHSDNPALIQQAMNGLFPTEKVVYHTFDLDEDQVLCYGIATSTYEISQKTWPNKIDYLPLEQVYLASEGFHLNFNRKTLHFCQVKNNIIIDTLSVYLNKEEDFIEALLQLFPALTTENVIVSGKISTYSRYYKALSLAFPRLSMAKIKNTFRFSQYFQDMPESQYYSLFYKF